MKKIYSILLLIVILISFIIGYRLGVYAQIQQTLQSIIEPGSMMTESSYIIFTDGTTVYARNGNTGEIEFSGNDASTVIQTTINALTNGGKIFIRSGTYDLNSPLIVNKVLTLEGESSTSTIIKAPPGDYAIKIGDGITRRDGNVFSDFWIQAGDSTSKGGMYFKYTTYNIISKVVISYFSQPYEFAIVFDYSWANTIIDSSIFNSQNGIKQTNVGYTNIYSSYINVWSYGTSATENIALYAENGAFSVFGSAFEGVGEASDIGLKSVWPGGNRLFSVGFEGGTFNKDIVINSNQLYDSVSYGGFLSKVDDPNKHFHAYDADGYVTENSGIATINSGTSVVVNHGLVATPTIVTVTPRSTGYGTIAVTARDETTFTIEVTRSGTYTIDWNAKV